MNKDILNNKKNHLIVGRAATGIYLIFASLGIKGKKVLFPANICYAAIYPVLYAGNIPVFCDVDIHTGNLTLEGIEEKINCDKEIVAMILPHMYGNPVKEVTKIKEFCAQKDIILIEDCASAMGATVDEIPVGTFGDYVLYSTGYAKTIELGYGGIVASDRDLQKMKVLYRKLPMLTKEIERNQAFFSKLYRLIRNDKEQTLTPFLYKGLYENVKDLYVYQLEQEKEDKIEKAILKLEEEIAIRKESCKLYNSFINDNDNLEKYVFETGAVPWRYNLLVLENRTEFIAYMLEKGMPISDWYPAVTDIFGDNGEYPNTKWMEERIVNFPLNVEHDEIKRICDAINTFFEN